MLSYIFKQRISQITFVENVESKWKNGGLGLHLYLKGVSLWRIFVFKKYFPSIWLGSNSLFVQDAFMPDRL